MSKTKQEAQPIMGITDIAEHVGVSRQLAKKWSVSWPDWPEPFARVSAGMFWRTEDVLATLARHERKPGEGPRAAGDPRPPSVANPKPKRKRARVVS